MTGHFGIEGYGTTPYGSLPGPFVVTGAEAQTGTLVEVAFSALLDAGFAATTDPGNYAIPGLTVTAVTRGTSSVLLTTSPQAAQTYVVTVTAAKDVLGRTLAPYGRTATFTGLINPAGARVVPTGPRRVRLIFSEPLARSADLLDPASYRITTVDGEDLLISGVVAEQTGNPVSMVVQLGEDLVPTRVYVARLSSDLLTPDGREVSPRSLPFQWAMAPLRAQVALGSFSGEVTGGLLGQHAGLVFFSPALLSPLASSVIQVDSVSACTKAYDEYHLPAPVDPSALFLWGGGAVTGLGDAVLWGGAGVLSEARVDLHQKVLDAAPQAADGHCVATLTEPFDVSYLAYLNNPYWTLNGSGGALFLCADNGAPIPPGPTTTITLVALALLSRRGARRKDQMHVRESLPAPHEHGLDFYLASRARDEYSGDPGGCGYIRGDVFLYMRDGETGELQEIWEKRNLVVKDASILIARLMKDPSEPPHGVFALAVGSGDVGWNPMSPPAPTVTQRALYSEISRKTLASTSFVDASGLPTSIPTNVVDFVCTFTESEAVGPLVEMGLIGGNVVISPRNPVSPPNGPYNVPPVDLTTKETLVNYLTFPVINKPPTSTLTIVWRLTF